MSPLQIDKDLLTPREVAGRMSVALRTLWHAGRTGPRNLLGRRGFRGLSHAVAAEESAG